MSECDNKFMTKPTFLFAISLPLFLSSCVNFLLFSFSNLYNEPKNYMPLLAAVAGIAGFVLILKSKRRAVQGIGFIGVLISVIYAYSDVVST